MSKYYWILDAGHGGIRPDGTYTTAPAKMFTFSDGYTIYEGVINRVITKKLQGLLFQSGIDFALVYDDVEDIPLSRRVALANKIFVKEPNAIYLSIHSNAGGGKGFEVFTSPGKSKSDAVAALFCLKYMEHFKDFAFREDYSDGDADKESQFYVLAKTNCPSILVENLFFDNRKEAEFLMSEDGQNRIAICLFEAIKETELKEPI